MSSSASTEQETDPPSWGWAQFLGTAIAILTLVVPTFCIIRYSSTGEELLPATGNSSTSVFGQIER